MARTRPFDDMPGCSMEAAVKIIMGKWKGVILSPFWMEPCVSMSSVECCVELPLGF